MEIANRAISLLRDRYHVSDDELAKLFPESALREHEGDVAPGDQGVESRSLTLVMEKVTLGFWSPEVISELSGVPLEEVKKAMVFGRGGYGIAKFGQETFGGSKSRGQSLLLRKVSCVGQMSYRGFCYSLGRGYRGRYVVIVDHGGPALVLLFGGLSPLNVAARHWAQGHLRDHDKRWVSGCAGASMDRRVNGER